MRDIVKKAAAFVLTIALILLPCGFHSYYEATAAELTATWPVNQNYKKITTYFDPMRNQVNSGYHNGIDIEADYAAPIYAVRGGKVISAGWMDAYGYMVILFHSDIGLYTFYAHCSSMAVSAGADVAQGQQIASVGSTGQSSGNHLHFGVCDTLLNGWPDITYYDPLTCFTYNGEVAPQPSDNDCDCSDSYAGIYKTKGVTSNLYIRSGHGSNFPAIGQIPAGSQVTVTKSNGKWAHVEFNGITGYSSMDYLEKIADLEVTDPEMTVYGASSPEGELVCGEIFHLRGVITSAFEIKRVWGGIYSADGSETKQYFEDTPASLTYDLSVSFDNKILFGSLPEGSYTYRIEAEDIKGNRFTVIETKFSEVVSAVTYASGDVNLDRDISIADAVILQNYLLGRCTLDEQQGICADFNSDGKVTVLDLMQLKRCALKVTQ